MKKFSNTWTFILLVIALPAGAFGIYNIYDNHLGSLPVLAETDEHPIADFSLTNQEGITKTTADWNNKIVITDFFFTHCPTVCPKMTKSLQKVQTAFKDDAGILIQSISIDPERDSVAQLKNYIKRFDINTNNWQFLTGPKKDIYKMARNSFQIVATDGDGGPQDFIHSEKLILIDTEKRIRGYYNGTDAAEVQQLIRDIKKLKNEH
ncbi:MAG: SCO family protein [Chitinophagaceae bacterium]|nr:SCO family protein [Chitinophagaceae bacterium]MCB0740309.1 SCO family protein [Chitinophagaceae bacterium]